MKRITLVVLFAILLVSAPQYSLLNSTTKSVERTSTGNSTFVFDSFESFNSTDETVVMALDSQMGEMVGCAQFDGSIQNTNFGGAQQMTSNGGDDILLFGWNLSLGYWSIQVGGQGDETCQKVRWTSPTTFGFVGSFRDEITIGGLTYVSHGKSDAIAGFYNVSSQQWTNVLTIGTPSDDVLWSFIPLANGTHTFVGSSGGNLTEYTNISGSQDCTPSGSSTTTKCMFILNADASLNPTTMMTLLSTGSVMGRDIIEIGTSGKTMVTGYFNRELQINPPINSENNGNDLFILRLSPELERKYLTTFGGNGSDWGLTIASIPSGFAVSGMSESTALSRAQTRYPSSSTWTAPIGQGEEDGMVLKTSVNGVIQDGFLFGSPEVDLIYDMEVDAHSHLHVSGFIGSEMQYPQSGQYIGLNNERSAFYGIVNLSGGNTSHLIGAYASSGSSNSDGRANAVTVSSTDDVWIGGRLAPGPQSNAFFGQAADGYVKAGYILRVGSDHDGDQQPKRTDNCPSTHNPGQLNYDDDAQGDACDDDDDNDSIDDSNDLLCPFSTPRSFVSTPNSDHDGDGCADEGEDLDDDNDGFSDLDESDSQCPKGHTNWTAGNLSTDRDADGCHDLEEDLDDDGDSFIDSVNDRCSSSTSIVFNSATWMDLDLDGCHDEEDPDLDNDGIINELDNCGQSLFGWISETSTDHDSDGCRDDGVENEGYGEDTDDDNDGVHDAADMCTPPTQLSILGTAEFPVWADHDNDGCHDQEDDDYDNDGILNTNDQCPFGFVGWQSDLFNDRDIDGCLDSNPEDSDDDNDGKDDAADECDAESGFLMSRMNWTSNFETDYDDDGCLDQGPENSGYGEDTDDDNDLIVDAQDVCPTSNLLLSQDDKDSDGCLDDEDTDIDGDGFENPEDSCPEGRINLIVDLDNDGCQDTGSENNGYGEDTDDDNDGVLDGLDQCDPNNPGPHLDEWTAALLRPSNLTESEDRDRDGCADGSIEDLDDDNDGILDENDDCTPGKGTALEIGTWISNQNTNDYDGDGCKDSGTYNGGLGEDTNDDGDPVQDPDDRCDPDSNKPASIRFWTDQTTNDKDEDGCHDEREDTDQQAIKTNADNNQKNQQILIIASVLTIVFVAVVALAFVKMRSPTNVNVIGSKDVVVNIDQSDKRGSINEDTHYSNMSQDE